MDRKLIDYLPPFIKSIREIKIIMNCEDTELEALWHEVGDVLDDQFILHATLNGVKRWEKILKLQPKATDTLKSRKIRILNQLNVRLPYTYRMLIERLEQLCGSGNYLVSCNFNQYEISIKTHLDTVNKIEELCDLLKHILPANIIVQTHNTMFLSGAGKIYIGGIYKMGTRIDIYPFSKLKER